MATALKEELAKVGISLNAGKTKVLTTSDDNNVEPLDLGGQPVEILTGDMAHKYLGRKLCGNLRAMSSYEVGHRIQIAWMRFHQHRDILTNKHLSRYSRIKFFDAVITPTILFGLSSCAMTRARMCSLDTLQRRMLRKIVGWTRVVDEPWEDTMRRMRLKVDSALTEYPMEDWSAQLLRRQFRLAYRVGNMTGSWPARLSRRHPLQRFLELDVDVDDPL